MEEIEVPTEQVQEEVQHHAHSEHGPSWTSKVALSTAILAVLAAVSALLAGDHVDEAMIDQIRASDQWSFFQSKGIKAALLSSKMELLEGQGKSASEKDREKLGEYKKEQEEITREAKEKESASREHLHKHVIFARAVTMFQIAIAVAAVSVLTRKRRFWAVSLAFGCAGALFLGYGFIN